MEVDDSDGENQTQEDEELVAFSDFHSDEESQEAHSLTNALGSANATIPGVRRYKKSDQKARMTAADAKIQEVKTIIENLEAAMMSEDVDRDVLKEEKKKWLVKLGEWKKEKLQARNAINHRRLQMRVRQKYGSEKQKTLNERDKEFEMAYREAYEVLAEKFCDHESLQCDNCKICYARVLFGNITCLTISSDKAFEETQRPPEPREHTKLPKIVADTPEEAKKLKRERDRNCLRAFRERQKKKIQGMDERLKFYEDSKELFRTFYINIGPRLNKPAVVIDESEQKRQPYLINCVRQFAEIVDVTLPNCNIHLESDQFLEKFMDYLAETFLLLLRHSIGFEEIREEECLKCNQKTEITDDFHHYIQDLPAIVGVKKFEDVIHPYQQVEETLTDCQKCSEKKTLKVSRSFSMKKTETQYLLVCLPKGKVFFPKPVEFIFDSPMELIFFITVNDIVYKPCKKTNGRWFCHSDGKWGKTQLPLTCSNVPYIVFKKQSYLLP